MQRSNLSNENGVRETDGHPVAKIVSQCAICKVDADKLSLGVLLKCQGCSYQSHARCCYQQGAVPVSLLNPESKAFKNWRCYDCKCCQICNKNDDENDNMLLCDGCDAGEHMGCQNPPLQDIPPAPWYCSTCHCGSSKEETKVNITSDQPPRLSSNVSSDGNMVLTIADDSESPAELDSRASAKPPSTEVGDRQSESVESCCTLETSAQSAWTAILNSDTPPLSEAPNPQDQDGQEGDKGEKQMPIKLKLEKRPCDSTWKKCGSDSPNSGRERRSKTRKTISNSGPPDNEVIQVTATARPVVEIVPSALRESEENNGNESTQLPADGVTSIDEQGAMETCQARSWSIDRVEAFFKLMGYEDIAKAFKREEIDGPALLLLQRHDVICNFGVKLGPALKAFEIIQHVQEAVRYR